MTANKPPVQAALDVLHAIINDEPWLMDIEKAHADLQKWVDDVPRTRPRHLDVYTNEEQAKHLLKGVSDE